MSLEIINANVKQLRGIMRNSPELVLTDAEIMNLPVSYFHINAFGRIVNSRFLDMDAAALTVRYATKYAERTTDYSVETSIDAIATEMRNLTPLKI